MSQNGQCVSVIAINYVPKGGYEFIPDLDLIENSLVRNFITSMFTCLLANLTACSSEVFL